MTGERNLETKKQNKGELLVILSYYKQHSKDKKTKEY